MVNDLAEKRLKLERAEAHAVTAQQYVVAAEEEVQYLEKELESVLSPAPSRSDSALQSFQNMAEALSSLQATSEVLQCGAVKVDPAMMAKLASFVTMGAKAVSPVKRRKVAPWRREAEQSLWRRDKEHSAASALDSVQEERGVDTGAQSQSSAAGSTQIFRISTPKNVPPKLHTVKRTFTVGVGKMTPVQRMSGKFATKTVTKADLKTWMRGRTSLEMDETEEGNLSV